jgi:hypothetical protein
VKVSQNILTLIQKVIADKDLLVDLFMMMLLWGKEGQWLSVVGGDL